MYQPGPRLLLGSPCLRVSGERLVGRRGCDCVRLDVHQRSGLTAACAPAGVVEVLQAHGLAVPVFAGGRSRGRGLGRRPGRGRGRIRGSGSGEGAWGRGQGRASGSEGAVGGDYGPGAGGRAPGFEAGSQVFHVWVFCLSDFGRGQKSRKVFRRITMLCPVGSLILSEVPQNLEEL